MTDQTIDADASRVPCGVCDRSVDWGDRGVACESCGAWFHASCQNIGSHTYLNDLNDSDISWHCVICANQNHSATLFDLHGVGHESPWTSSTMSVPDADNEFKPLHSSTPTRSSQHGRQRNRPLRAVSYTHLTLPTSSTSRMLTPEVEMKKLKVTPIRSHVLTYTCPLWIMRGEEEQIRYNHMQSLMLYTCSLRA